MTAAEMIKKARAGLILDAPFFGTIAIKTQTIEDPAAVTMCTNGSRIRYNPAFVQTLTLTEVKAVLAHEVLHVANLHHTRRADRKPEKWNAAADHAINGILERSGFTLPKGCLQGIDEAAEKIYSQIPDPPPGSGNGPGGVEDAPGSDTEQGRRQIEQQAKQGVIEAANAARACGKLPADIARMVDELMEPVIPWREILRRFITETAKADYSWTRPNPRYMARGLYLPALKSEEMRPLVVAVDTSGSIDAEILKQFAAELNGIHRDTHAPVTVIYCDAKVSHVDEFTPDDEITINAAGGGGTDFCPPFEYVTEHEELNPAALVYLTDGECSSFPEPPAYPVLWGIIGSEFDPPFGEALQIKN